ncbi:hypothetical protein D1007_32054 [Hordeum vulgare]|nr:hypothetical protein D1007_32054 [Hordeum vulgare]
MAEREGGNRVNQVEGGGEGRIGRGGGRFGRGGGRDRGGGGGGRNLVWMRDIDDGGKNSSNMDQRHGSSDKARWEAATMETQGGGHGFEKWGDSINHTVVGGAPGGRQQQHLRRQHGAYQAQERRHPTPGKRNASPLVGGAQVCVTCKESGHLPVYCLRAVCGRCVGAKGILNVAWVNVSSIPLDKRHKKNIAYVGSLVGVTLEIDKATINTPESVRIKLGCRDAEDIPTSAEGVLGADLYDFFFSVNKILVKIPPKEKVNVQLEADGGASPERARLNGNKRLEGQIASSSSMEESSAPPGMAGGRNVKNMNLEPLKETEENEKNHNNSEEIQSEEESEEVDNVLLIDTRAAEAEKNQLKDKENLSPEIISYDKIVVISMQIVLSPKKDQAYSMYSLVTSNENMDVIPTPPAMEEVQTRFSKRTTGINMEHVGVKV